ncbi:MAG: hypothetical protein VKP62_11240 [Candidatus Sericytochromatia bacterium]|nr:hypothetical protein [Candidatus Sericytochromatia bacterium]
MMAKWLLTVGMTVLALSPSLTAMAAPARSAPAGLMGQWIYDPAQSDDVDQAIQRAAEKINYILRGFAHGRLKDTNHPYRTVAITQQGADTLVKKDDRQPLTAPTSGASTKWKREDGQIYDVTLRWQGQGRLEESIGNHEGKRINLYSLRADGRTMDLHVSVSSTRLPVPLSYRLAYRRVP